MDPISNATLLASLPIGYLVFIRKVDPFTMLPIVAGVTASVFLLCLHIQRQLWQMKQYLLLRQTATIASRTLTPERKFRMTERGARLFANVVLTVYYGLFFYVFAQGFFSRQYIAVNFAVSATTPLLALTIVCWYFGRSSESKH